MRKRAWFLCGLWMGLGWSDLILGNYGWVAIAVAVVTAVALTDRDARTKPAGITKKIDASWKNG